MHINTEDCTKQLMESRTPTKDDLVLSLRNFFEGPINLDLMMLGTVKNMSLPID